MKIAVVGFDTSHSYEFPSRIRKLAKSNHRYRELEFLAGWPGNPSTAVHPEILEDTKKDICSLGIKAVEDLDKLIEQSDGFLLESVNGDTHLELARKLLPSGKPTFIDKPFANTVEDAAEIVKIAAKFGTPVWSSSALRFDTALLKAMEKAGGKNFSGIDVFGPAPYFEKGRGIVYYGIHTAEMIFAVMGTGIKSVCTYWNEKCEVVVGKWSDGRIATLRGQREPRHGFGGTVHGINASIYFEVQGDSFYDALSSHLAEFFVTGKSAVPITETIEIIAFLDAAVRSKEANGAEIFI